MSRTARLSLRRKLTGLMAFASLLGLGLSALALIVVTGYFARQTSERDLVTMARVIADNSRTALSFGDSGTALQTLSAVQAKREITLVCLFASAGKGTPRDDKPFAVFPPDRGNECAAKLWPGADDLASMSLTVQQPVQVDNEQIGVLTMTQDLRPLREILVRQVGVTLMVVALAFALTFGFALREQVSMVAPLLRLAAVARKVSQTADYRLRADVRANDEVGELAEDFNRMLAQIDASDAEVRAASDALSSEVERKSQATAELQRTLHRLTDTQAQLVQSEKMASLGALVAGVAHEINTPVGVSVTAASTLQAKASEIARKHSDGSMKRSDLEGFVRMAGESTHILLANLHRAAELIQSFKRVAVDQTSDERRKFVLANYIGEVLLSLGPKLKKQVEVTVECAPQIVIDSYPGALAQILTNFVTNSLLHGFDDGRHGHIWITAETEGDQLLLTYRDNGKGVDQATLARIFDPFFTTKRGSGGSGLGMHIVFNLIVQRLGGRITATSTQGEGLKLSLRLPLSAPRPLPSEALPA